MRIGICDDEQIFTDMFSSRIMAYMKKKGQSDYELKIYTDSADLLESLTETDLLFLDIEMGETDLGIQIKKVYFFSGNRCQDRICNQSL